MSKIICDVCGTRYPESAEQCPICGRVSGAEKKNDSDEVEGTYGREYSHTKGGHFSKANVKKRTAGAPIVEIPKEPAKPEPVEEDEEEVFVAPEKKKKSGCFINFLLIIVILALLAVSAYIGLQYVAPQVLEDYNFSISDIKSYVSSFFEAPATEEPTTEMPTEATTEEPTTEEPTTEATVPCTDLVILDSMVVIDEVGQSYLLNAAVAPEDTTDALMYSSSDEGIATVNDEGRITAVGAGEATITVSCGEFSVECKVLCAPGDITLPADNGETTATEATTGEPTEATEATTGAETTATEATTAPTKPVQLKDVTLSVKATDVTFVHRGQRATFKLTCGLANNEVTWTSQDETIITVDENGVATCVGYGTTNVIVSYGDQQVTILVRCTKK